MINQVIEHFYIQLVKNGKSNLFWIDFLEQSFEEQWLISVCGQVDVLSGRENGPRDPPGW